MGGDRNEYLSGSPIQMHVLEMGVDEKRRPSEFVTMSRISSVVYHLPLLFLDDFIITLTQHKEAQQR
jgi:hypothetical protein